MSTADRRMYEDKAMRKRIAAEPAAPPPSGTKRPSVFAKIPPETAGHTH